MGPTENAPSRCPTALPASLPLSRLRPVTPGATLLRIPPELRRRALTTVGTYMCQRHHSSVYVLTTKQAKAERRMLLREEPRKYKCQVPQAATV